VRNGEGAHKSIILCTNQSILPFIIMQVPPVESVKPCSCLALTNLAVGDIREKRLIVRADKETLYEVARGVFDMFLHPEESEYDYEEDLEVSFLFGKGNSAMLLPTGVEITCDTAKIVVSCNGNVHVEDMPDECSRDLWGKKTELDDLGELMFEVWGFNQWASSLTRLVYRAPNGEVIFTEPGIGYKLVSNAEATKMFEGFHSYSKDKETLTRENPMKRLLDLCPGHV
jgi:hypothetical protein